MSATREPGGVETLPVSAFLGTAVAVDVPAGDYDLAVMPLLIPGSDGAPARAVLTRGP